MILWTALLLGLGGSLHCVGMCGPIAMALPLTTREKSEVVVQSLLYHFGRITTYALMGFFFGILGWGIALAGYQNILSIALGILLLITAFFAFSIENRLFGQAFFVRLMTRVKDTLSRLLAIRSRSSAFGIGLVNGLLPCGLVYIALLGAITTGDYWLGSLYMAAFGLGTLPLLLGVMLFGNWSRSFLRGFQKVIPYGLAIFGIYLIYRGMILELPTELRFWENTNFPVMCH